MIEGARLCRDAITPYSYHDDVLVAFDREGIDTVGGGELLEVAADRGGDRDCLGGSRGLCVASLRDRDVAERSDDQ